MNKPSRRRRVPRSPFVVTFAVAAIGACGGTAFNGEGGSAAASGAAGSAGKSGSGTGAEGGAAGSGFGGSSAGTGGGPGGTGGSPNCPTVLPGSGTPCATSEVCYYPTGPCCPPTQASCVNGQWMYSYSTCNPPAPMCPLDPPMDGTPCMTDPCVGYVPDCTYGFCSDGTPSLVAHCDGSVWRLSRATCPSQDGGALCASQEQALRDYANANKTCQLNTDCMAVYAGCAEGADFCDGSYFVNHSIDLTNWQSLSSALQQCLSANSVGCAVCNIMSPPPACVNGTCTYGLATVDGGGV